MNTENPSDESLRKCLELQWQDHIHTRAQTWKSLEIQAALVIALVGLDWRLDSLIATTVFGIVLAITAYFGFRITLHHRSVEIRKFTHILNIEEKLGLHRKGLLADVRPPEAISWADVFKPRKSNTPLFILRMHGAVMLFAVLYVASRWFLQLGAWPR